MALRTIRIQGDPVLTKVCRPIPEVTDRIRTLAEDMLETMYEANGVGLAAPQVGILKRMVVIDIGDGQGPFIMINPEIIESDGEQTGDEGCLSLPGKAGQVTRPNYVKARAFDENLEVEKYVRTTKKELIQEGKERIRYLKKIYKMYKKDKRKYRREHFNNIQHLKFIKTVPSMAKWNDEKIYKYEIRFYKEDEITEDGGIYSTYNPKSKWDWYEIGRKMV